ncbi:hypothetical protein [Microbacterium suwonense]|uniref:Uncharacterized protein n=1 Tax=Microbacterium suwonense TaxID=683047 RepID=A0ABM8FVF5_9MICO|nr:hypothetical protein [Microbacterium suwonense]BDZ39588.1 hypothetical protein GCM10025863_22020 [Microbacterium suwonense]
MGKHLERLDRLKANRISVFVLGTRLGQDMLQLNAKAAVGTVTQGLQKAAREEGFEGDLGTAIHDKLMAIHKDLGLFTEYQADLSKVITLANQALQDTANGIDGLPAAGLTPQQQSTIDMAAKTGSPVQVAPGVTLSPEKASKWYLDQAEADQEEAARKMTVALDKRIQELIDDMPLSKFDKRKRKSESSDEDGPGRTPTVDAPRLDDGGTGVTVPGDGPGGTGGDDPSTRNPRPRQPHVQEPPVIRDPRWDPPVVDPPVVDPPILNPPVLNPPIIDPPIGDPRIPEDPNIDGGTDGVVPGGPPGGVNPPGGVTGPGGGITGPGGGGAAGTVGGGAGVVGRVGGAGLLGGVGRVGGVGGIGGVGGVGGAGSASASGGSVVAQSGAAGGARGMVTGGGAAGGRGGKRNRRRGLDLQAYEVEAEDEETMPDLGAAGSAGRAQSDGTEELGW